MDRLTSKNYEYVSCDFMEDGVYEFANKLRELEDIFEEYNVRNIKDLKNRLDYRLTMKKDIMDEWKAFKSAGLSPEHCAELGKAENAGLLVKLPCKVGGTVLIRNGCFNPTYVHDKVRQISTYHNGGDDICINVFVENYGKKAWGKSAFPEDYISEDAEKALEGEIN